MGILTPPKPPGGPTNPYRTSGWASRSLSDLRLGLPTPLDFQWGLPDLRVSLPTPPRPPSGLADPTQSSGWAK